MDVQESAEELERNEDQEMDIGQDSSHDTHHPKICQGAQGDVNLSPRVVLGERYRPSHSVNEANRENTSTKGPQKDVKSATQIRPAAKRHDVPIPKTSMEEYRRKMEGKPTVNNHVSSMYPASEKAYTTRHRVNNLPTQKEAFQHIKQEKKKPPVTKTRPAHSSRGFLWYLCSLCLLILLSSSAILLAYMIVPVLRGTAGGGEHPSRALTPEKFADHLTVLETQFPSQRPDVWKRSKIHLEKHLNTAQPTEPVSLIFTAGLRAERTLLCLAQGLASAFSSALNASVLHIDGASKANQDSDGVKLEIDSQFRAAFEGDKPVALIHRLEELPPGSTLIFYRYCDHENAAYKRVFLLFTVLLPHDEVRADQSLKEVEEMVHDYVKERLVGDGSQAAFNDMDIDKYGGLWSRISHLILPVVSEKEVEEKGC
ncbi:torsin-1A-interacting protein 2-like isoform X2 [Acanthopagrus latus]|nr:torsin-1A-interacting protein 2-like isoform X2 [Acanthopagrus latus]